MTSRTTNKARSPGPLDALAVPDALLRIALVETLTGLSRQTIYRKVQAGDFCRPIKLSSRCTRWRAGDVHAWLVSRKEAAHA
ncbi:AlpA family phage regulatory protein [uncultured Aquabacterium sp.]|uniref:helix-turn-helix transcriptional regulator n=1 Tax=uncultured Aquabacterium sp. TaxID=158753 RepID=UPI0026103B40|nr:AlpA family phage regulatory protein [uncultured Aquabacterium sp.]